MSGELGKSRNCYHCGRELSEDNAGRLCIVCSNKIDKGMVTEEMPHYSVKEMRYILGLGSDESVRRLGRKGKIPGKIPGIKRHLYNKEDVDNWIEKGAPRQINPKIPTNPLQEEAYAMCNKKDHSWFAEDRFEGIAFHVKIVSSRADNFITVLRKLTCYFCGYTQETSV